MPGLITYEDYCLIPEDGNRYEVIVKQETSFQTQ